jgi:hypothetical protein
LTAFLPGMVYYHLPSSFPNFELHPKFHDKFLNLTTSAFLNLCPNFPRNILSVLYFSYRCVLYYLCDPVSWPPATWSYCAREICYSRLRCAVCVKYRWDFECKYKRVKYLNNFKF